MRSTGWWRALGALTSVVVGVGATSCGEPDDATQVVVVFDAEESVRADADALRVRVWNHEGDEVLDDTRSLTSEGGTLATVPLVPENGDPDRSFAIEGTLLTADGDALGAVEAGGRYREGELVRIRLRFTAECRDQGDCGEGRTCRLGVCLGACVAVEASDDPARPRCGECEACVGGACVPRSDGSQCGCDGDDQCFGGRCSPGRPVTNVASGSEHTCALLDRDLHCWGNGSVGRLGAPAGSGATVDVALEGPAQGAVGALHTCWLTHGSQRRRYCWGWAGDGRLGLPLDDAINSVSTPTEATGDPVEFSSVISAGTAHTCALDAAGTAWCWGANEAGQSGSEGPGAVPAPVAVDGGPWRALDAGGQHACAILRDDDSLWCWGGNASGELGTGDAVSSSTPRPIRCTRDDCPTEWLTVAAGAFHTCAIARDESLWCWGGGLSGQLGQGSESQQNLLAPGPVAGGPWQLVAAGARHTCAVDAEGALWCWGANAHGELGLGDRNPRVHPARVEGPTGSPWVEVALGTEHTCTVTDERSLYCWGANGSGQSGAPPETDDDAVTRPRRVCLE